MNTNKSYLFIYLVIILFSNTYGQTTFQTVVGGLYSEYPGGIQPTSDGGYIVAGTSFIGFGPGISATYLVKFNSNGTVAWTKTYGGSDYEFGGDVLQTTDGGYIIVSTTESFGSGINDIYVVKTNVTGDTLWTRVYGTAGFDQAFRIRQTTDGGYLILGEATPAAGWDLMMLKISATGNIQFSKVYGGTGGLNTSGNIIQTGDGGYIFTGAIGKQNSAKLNMCLIKTNNIGVISWYKIFKENMATVGQSVYQTTDGGYLISGYTIPGPEAGILIKTDSIGNITWSKKFGGPNFKYFDNAIQTNEGGYIISGTTYIPNSSDQDGMLIKTNANGDTLWTKTYGGNLEETLGGVRQTADGGYVLMGITASFGAGDNDIVLVKTDSIGNSGCNQGIASIQITSANITDTNQVITSVPYNIIQMSPLSLTSAGGTVLPLCVNLGISELKQEKISIYPNPFSYQTTLEFDNKFENATVTIYDIMGKNIKSYSSFSGRFFILYRESLKAGTYLIRITDKDRIRELTQLITVY